MINDLNRVTLMGHLGADAKQASANAPVTFSIATTSRWTDDQKQRQQRTEWHNITVFGNLGKYALKLKKGDRVYVEGELRSNDYEKDVKGEKIKIPRTEIAALQIDLLNAKAEGEDNEE